MAELSSECILKTQKKNYILSPLNTIQRTSCLKGRCYGKTSQSALQTSVNLASQCPYKVGIIVPILLMKKGDAERFMAQIQ